MPLNKQVFRTSFNSGEISPELFFRSDLSKYQSGCRKLENFLINPLGGIKRRPQTKFLKSLGTGIENVRIIPFEFSNDQNYAVVLIDREGTVNIEVYDADGVLELEVEDVPYPAESLGKIKYAQSYDVLYIVHPEVPPKRLERRVDGFAFVDQVFNGGPYEDQNTDREKKIGLYAFPWIDGESYEVGDYVTGTAPSDMKKQGFDDLAKSNAIPYVDGYRQEVVNVGGEDHTRYYQVMNFTVPHRGGEELEGFVKFGNIGGYLEDNAFKILGYSSNALYDIISCETGLYFEEDELEALVIDQTITVAGLPKNQTTEGDVQVYFLQELNEVVQSYRCIQATSSEDTTNDAYWELTYNYKGKVLVDASAFAYDFFDAMDIGDYLGVRIDQEASFKTAFYTRTSEDLTYILKGGLSDDVSAADATIASSASWELGDTTQVFYCTGLISLKTKGGTWTGRLRLQTSEDGGETWETIAVIESNANNNESLEREVSLSGTLGRLVYDRDTVVDGGEFELQSRCLIICNISSQSMTEMNLLALNVDGGSAIFDLAHLITSTEETFKWSKRAFRAFNGYPSCVEFHEERLWLAGIPNNPNTLYSSMLNNFEEYGAGTFATSPLQFTISSDKFNPIVSILSKDNLAIFTTSAEFSIGSRNSQEVLSGETVSVRRHSNYGSNYLDCEMFQELTVYVNRDDTTLMGMTTTDEFAPYSSTELNSFSTHIAGSGWLDYSIARSPDNIWFGLREDGQISTLVYSRAQEVLGWSRLKFGDGVQASTVVSQPKFDKLYLIVNRDGESVLEAMDLGDTAFLDCYFEVYDAGGVSSFNLQWDAPSNIELWSGYQKLVEDVDYTRSGVEITMDKDCTTVQAGFSYQHEVSTTDFEIAPTAKGRIVRLLGFDIFHRTAAGGEFRYGDNDPWKEIVWHTILDEELLTLDNANPTKTIVDVSSQADEQVRIDIRGFLPQDLEILCIAVDAERN